MNNFQQILQEHIKKADQQIKTIKEAEQKLKRIKGKNYINIDENQEALDILNNTIKEGEKFINTNFPK